MRMFPVLSGGSKYNTVTATSQQITLPTTAGAIMLFSTSTACYVLQGSNPTATAGNDSVVVNPGESILVEVAQGAKLAVLRVAADGVCTLTPVKIS